MLDLFVLELFVSTAPQRIRPRGLAAEARDQKIHKASHLGREMPPRRIERMQPLLRRRIVGQQAYQAAGAQVVADDEGRQQDDAAAGDRSRAQDISRCLRDSGPTPGQRFRRPLG